MAQTPRVGEDLSTVSLSSVVRWGDNMPVVTITGEDFFIGSHLAELLKRETFNLYGSFKRRKIPICHAHDNLLKLLVFRGTVYAGTTSVTLVQVAAVSEFVELGLAENEKRKGRGEPASKKREPVDRAAVEVDGAADGAVMESGSHLDLLISALEEHEAPGDSDHQSDGGASGSEADARRAEPQGRLAPPSPAVAIAESPARREAPAASVVQLDRAPKRAKGRQSMKK